MTDELGCVIILLTLICTVPAFSWLSAVTSLFMTILSADSYKVRITKIIRGKTNRITLKITCALFYIIAKCGRQKLCKAFKKKKKKSLHTNSYLIREDKGIKYSTLILI